jgi:hypothetical protein
MKSTLEAQAHPDKKEKASTHIAENFNKIVTDIASAFPELASSLPSPISSSTPLAQVGMSDAQYVDLEVYCEQILNLLDLIE